MQTGGRNPLWSLPSIKRERDRKEAPQIVCVCVCVRVRERERESMNVLTGKSLLQFILLQTFPSLSERVRGPQEHGRHTCPIHTTTWTPAPCDKPNTQKNSRSLGLLVRMRVMFRPEWVWFIGGKGGQISAAFILCPKGKSKGKSLTIILKRWGNICMPRAGIQMEATEDMSNRYQANKLLKKVFSIFMPYKHPFRSPWKASFTFRIVKLRLAHGLGDGEKASPRILPCCVFFSHLWLCLCVAQADTISCQGPCCQGGGRAWGGPTPSLFWLFNDTFKLQRVQIFLFFFVVAL